MKYFKLFSIIGIFGFFACTDATCSKTLAFGSSATVECYSGGKLIYKGKSTGKVKSEETSDGYYFQDAKDQSLKEVSGNCVITYE